MSCSIIITSKSSSRERWWHKVPWHDIWSKPFRRRTKITLRQLMLFEGKWEKSGRRITIRDGTGLHESSGKRLTLVHPNYAVRTSQSTQSVYTLQYERLSSLCEQSGWLQSGVVWQYIRVWRNRDRFNHIQNTLCWVSISLIRIG